VKIAAASRSEWVTGATTVAETIVDTSVPDKMNIITNVQLNLQEEIIDNTQECIPSGHEMKTSAVSVKDKADDNLNPAVPPRRLQRYPTRCDDDFEVIHTPKDFKPKLTTINDSKANTITITDEKHSSSERHNVVVPKKNENTAHGDIMELRDRSDDILWLLRPDASSDELLSVIPLIKKKLVQNDEKYWQQYCVQLIVVFSEAFRPPPSSSNVMGYMQPKPLTGLTPPDRQQDIIDIDAHVEEMKRLHIVRLNVCCKVLLSLIKHKGHIIKVRNHLLYH
jgi:hypothetical protein